MSFGLLSVHIARPGPLLFVTKLQLRYKFRLPSTGFSAVVRSPLQRISGSHDSSPLSHRKPFHTSNPYRTSFKPTEHSLSRHNISYTAAFVPPRTLSVLQTKLQHTLAPSEPPTMPSTRSSKRKQENDVSQTAKRRKPEPAVLKDDQDEMSIDGDQSPKALNGAESDSEEEVQISGKIAAVAETREWQATIERVVSTAVSIVRCALKHTRRGRIADAV